PFEIALGIFGSHRAKVDLSRSGLRFLEPCVRLSFLETCRRGGNWVQRTRREAHAQNANLNGNCVAFWILEHGPDLVISLNANGHALRQCCGCGTFFLFRCELASEILADFLQFLEPLPG